MSADTATRTLSPTDAKAIKKADSIVLRYREGVATIEATLRNTLDQDRIFTAAEQRTFPETDPYSLNGDRSRIIEVEGAIWSYSDGSHDRSSQVDPKKAQGFWMASSAKFNATWRTIAFLLRPGDEVTVSFVGNANSNELTREANLHADKVELHVKRGDNRLVFMVDVSVCRNNSARMVKPRG